MVSGKIIISNSFNESIKFEDSSTINVNPQKLLEDIKSDFQAFIVKLKTDSNSRSKFDRMYSNI